MQKTFSRLSFKELNDFLLRRILDFYTKRCFNSNPSGFAQSLFCFLRTGVPNLSLTVYPFSI